jgi:glycosyltransferase involved in cell wall biosynthesis
VGLIVQSLSLLKQPFEWTHFGDGKEMEMIQAMTKEFPAHGQFCLKGARPRQEIFDYYQHQPIDLFLNLSITEGVPVSVMEALSYGIPVIATDAGGTRELVDSQVGSLIPIGVAAEEVAAAIVRVLSDPPAGIREAARKRAQQLCDGQKNYARFAERLLGLC